MKLVRKIKNNFHSFTDIWLFISILFWATLLPLIVKFLPLPRSMQIITPSKTHRYIKIKNSAQEKIVQYTDYILNLNVWIWRTTCLKRSLLLYRFLKKMGMNVQVCFGVKFTKGMISNDKNRNLDGHAWLLLNGEIFLEKNIDMVREYKITYCFPTSRLQAEHGSC
jgi:hypothetical protein